MTDCYFISGGDSGQITVGNTTTHSTGSYTGTLEFIPALTIAISYAGATDKLNRRLWGRQLAGAASISLGSVTQLVSTSRFRRHSPANFAGVNIDYATPWSLPLLEPSQSP